MKEPSNFEEIVPGRPTAAELRVMALRQQQQISTQHQLLAAKEQRLRFLKAQDANGAVAAAEGERLRRLRERVEAQESKLRRLRALRGQVDLQKTYNVTLSNDLDSIRALFSEKEKELSLAVAKVEALTRQLEDLRKDRRGPLNLISNLAASNAAALKAGLSVGNNLLQNGQKMGNSNGTGGMTNGNGSTQSPTARELDKLRRELMYRNQLSLQQDARLHLQREALQQRQAELRSVDLRILELQNRLQRKKASNLLLAQGQIKGTTEHPNGMYQQQSQQVQMDRGMKTARPSVNVYPSQRVLMPNSGHVNHHGNNVAAVEPFIHQPQKQISPPLPLTKSHSQFINRQHQQSSMKQQFNLNNLMLDNVSNGLASECDDQKLKQLVNEHPHNESKLQQSDEDTHMLMSRDGIDDAVDDGDADSNQSSEFSLKKSDPKYQTLPYNTKFGLAPSNNVKTTSGHQSPAVTSSSSVTITSTSIANQTITTTINTTTNMMKANECDSEKIKETTTSVSGGVHKQQGRQQSALAKPSQLTGVHRPTKSGLATPTSPGDKLKSPGISTMAVPPRKPISSVAPTTAMVTSSTTTAASSTMIPKIVPKMVQMVAPNNSSSIPVSVDNSNSPRPALPPKPHNGTSSSSPQSSDNEAPPRATKQSLQQPPPLVTKSKSANSIPTIVSVINKTSGLDVDKKKSEESMANVATMTSNGTSELHLPIKAKPLTIKKQPLHDQPKLKSSVSSANNGNNSGLSTNGNGGSVKPYLSRRIEMPPSFLLPEIKTAELKPGDDRTVTGNQDETDRVAVEDQQSSVHNKSSSISSVSSVNSEQREKTENSAPRRSKTSLSTSGGHEKQKLARRVSFDPLALLLDASLEGELELVRKTAGQVPNPSAANDEGITALHNAICAGHLEIVKFLVEFGCDVNAQDSDGWTPLHCAASCNNLAMVKFLVESGACLFAATLSDHETPAEKCEEDEEGFDGCSEYLYNIQEKLGIIKTGEVYAVFSYEAQHNDELSFVINDRLTILRKGDDAEREWWWARNGCGEEGYVPRNLLGLFPRIYRQPVSCVDSD